MVNKTQSEFELLTLLQSELVAKTREFDLPLEKKVGAMCRAIDMVVGLGVQELKE